MLLPFIASAVDAIPIPRPHSEDIGRFSACIKERADRLYSDFYSRHTSFKDKDVFELGAGAYAVRRYLELGVKSYWAANVSFTPDFYEIEDERARLVTTTDEAIPLHDSSVDVVISENCFEHLRKYESMMDEVHRILRPGGLLLTQFSPLYYSPYGAHFHDVTMVPWIHLLFSEQEVREHIERKAGTVFTYQWDQYATLNKLRPADFLKPLEGPRWRLITSHGIPFRPSVKWPRPLAAMFTHGMRIAAERR